VARAEKAQDQQEQLGCLSPKREKKGTQNMKRQQTIKRGAVRTALVGLAGLAGRTLAGAVAVLLISAGFGGRAWAITGGAPDGNRHSNVVAVIAYHPVYGLLPFTGTLIHPKVILTAGHAVSWIESGEVTLYGVSFGQEADLQAPSTWLPVSAMVAAFTGFNANPHGADIAALILQDPVTSVAPATLPTAGFLDDLRKAGQLQAGPQATRFTVVGYGYGPGLASAATHLPGLGRGHRHT
jgi:hypothetical protein